MVCWGVVEVVCNGVEEVVGGDDVVISTEVVGICVVEVVGSEDDDVVIWVVDVVGGNDVVVSMDVVSSGVVEVL